MRISQVRTGQIGTRPGDAPLRKSVRPGRFWRVRDASRRVSENPDQGVTCDSYSEFCKVQYAGYVLDEFHKNLKCSRKFRNLRFDLRADMPLTKILTCTASTIISKNSKLPNIP